jgi:hypothetical protein
MDLEGSPPALGSSRTTGGLLRGRALGNALNHADFPKVHSGDDFFTGSSEVDYKIFAYLVYNDPVKISVIPDPLLPANTIFRLSTLPPLEAGVVLKKVANRLESVKGRSTKIFNILNLLIILKLLMFFHNPTYLGLGSGI